MNTENKVITPIQFWFNRNTKLAIPCGYLVYNKIIISTIVKNSNKYNTNKDS